MLARISGGNSGIAEYLETGVKNGRDYSRDELDNRIILDGDLELTDKIINSIADKGQDRYLHITLSFRENEIPESLLRDITDEYKNLLMSAYKDDEFSFYAEAHLPKIKSILNNKTGEMVERKPHIHLVIPRVNLLSGNSLNPVGEHDKSIKYFEAIQEHINNKYKLESPKDFVRGQGDHYASVISRIKGDFFREKNGNIKQELFSKIENNEITSLSQFKEFVSSYGEIKIRNEGKSNEYIAFKMDGDSKFTNLNSPVFSKSFIEQNKLPFERPSDKQIQTRLQTWQYVASREIKYIYSANEKFRNKYKESSNSEKIKLLDDRENEYERKFRDGNGFDNGARRRTPSFKQGFKIFGRENFTQISHGLPSLPQRNVVHPIRKGINAGRVESVLHGNEGRSLGNEETNQYHRLRRSGYDKRGIEHSNSVSQLKKEFLNNRDSLNDKDYVRLIKSDLNPAFLLNHLSKTHNLELNKYKISFASDGSSRLSFGKNNLNISDFLTKHMNFSWQEAKEYLRDVYEKQINQEIIDPAERLNKSEWMDFRRNYIPDLYGRLNVAQSDLHESIRLMRYNSYLQYKSERGGIYSNVKDYNERKAALSIALVDRLKREELISEFKKSNLNMIYAIKGRSSIEHYIDFKYKRGHEMGIADPLLKFRNNFSFEQNSIVKADIDIGVKANIERAKKEAEIIDKAKERLKMNDLVAVNQKQGIVQYKSQKDGTMAFEDRGDRIVFNRNAEKEKIALGLEVAIAKYGRELKLTGSDSFKQLVVETAAEKGINIILKPEKYHEMYLAKLQEIQNNKDPEPAVEKAESRQPVTPEQPVAGQQVTPEQPVAGQQVTPEQPVAGQQVAPEQPVNRLEGTLIDHGYAPYAHDENNKQSYFVTIENADGYKNTVWGVDLDRALNETNSQLNEKVLLANLGRQSVSVPQEIKDETGKVVGIEHVDTYRNVWSVTNLDSKENERKVTQTQEYSNDFKKLETDYYEAITLIKDSKYPTDDAIALSDRLTERLDKLTALNGTNDVNTLNKLDHQLTEIIQQKIDIDRKGYIKDVQKDELYKVEYKWLEGSKFNMTINGQPAAEMISSKPEILDAFSKNEYLSKFSAEELSSGVIDEAGKGMARSQTIDKEGKAVAQLASQAPTKDNDIDR